MIEPKVIFENEDVLVVDKPAGVLVHGDGADASDTLVEWFLNRVPTAREVGEPRTGPDGTELERSGIVHRLDRDTSGVMILAKNQAAFEYLKAQFKTRTVSKEYRALVYEKMKEKWGTIDRPIGRSAKDWKLRSAEKGSRGLRRSAITDWECLQSGAYAGEQFSYLRLMPKTGRMHQLRVHLKSISRPIVGDPLYAEPKRQLSNNLGLDRLALHSYQLTLELPGGQKQTFMAPLPAEIERAATLIA